MPKQTSTNINYKDLFLEKIRQNYQSLILGFLVFLVVISIVVKFVKLPQVKLTTNKKIPEVAKQEKPAKKTVTYKIKEGDTLWAIAEEHFGSGFNAYDLALSNNLKNPDLIEIGQEIVIPSITPKQPTKGVIVEAKTEKVTLKEVNYKVKEGDYLWKIALEAYGDGYQWSKIAKINNLINPDIIYAGAVLIIPR
jgi:nucleoid-associated protein YgaU